MKTPQSLEGPRLLPDHCFPILRMWPLSSWPKKASGVPSATFIFQAVGGRKGKIKMFHFFFKKSSQKVFLILLHIFYEPDLSYMVIPS